MKRPGKHLSGDGEAKRSRGMPTKPLSFQEFLGGLEKADFTANQLAELSNKINDLYTIKANKISQFFPTDLWSQIFKQAALPKLPINQLLPLRLVSKNWNKVICSFPKINTDDHPQAIPRLIQIFNLKSITLPHGSAGLELDGLTRLKHLKLFSYLDATTDSHEWYNNMRDFSHLTNLTKLTLSSNYISSLGSLTSLTCLSLIWPYVITRGEVEKAPHLTRLVSNSRSIFPYGRGILKDNNGLYYDGEWKSNKWHGQGVYIHSPSSTCYKGAFENDTFHGHGLLSDGGMDKQGNLTDNVDYFEGQFVGDQRCGHGVFYFASGDKFEGEYANSHRSGHGIASYRNGDVFEGEWTSRLVDPVTKISIAVGRGVGRYVNGDRYEGEWIEPDLDVAKRHGHGTMYYANGEVLETQWKDDVNQCIYLD